MRDAVGGYGKVVPTPGTTIGGRYRLDHRLAPGGMSDVWSSTDVVLGRPVAVKVVSPALLTEPGFAQPSIRIPPTTILPPGVGSAR